MKKIVSILLLCFVGTSLFGQTHTEKTFLLPQPMRIPTQNTLYDYGQYRMARSKDLWGAHFQVTGFFRWDDNETDIGQYFGRNGKNIIGIGEGYTDFQTRTLIHNKDDSAAKKLDGSIELRPDREVRGVHLSYLQQLTRVSKNIYFNIHAPVIHTTHSMNPIVVDNKKATIGTEQKGIADYFCGNIEQTTVVDKQEPLKYAKICGSQSRTDLADVDILLSYQFAKNNFYYLRSSIGGVIPTAKKPTGEYLFEPINGNGQQWGVQTGVEAMAVLHKTDDTKIDLTCAYNIKHFFSNTQKRTIGFRSSDWSDIHAWYHYDSLGEQGKKGVFPAANVLTRDVKVSQGLLFDCNLSCNIYHNNWLINLGYNYFSRAEEDVTVKSWPNDTYARVKETYDTTADFDCTDLLNKAQDKAINADMLNPAVAATPALITHKLYALIGGTFNSIRIPVTVSFGGAYEFCQDNSALEGYELYFKAGISF